MMHRQQKPSLALRVVAVGCAVVWLAAVSACGLEALLDCGSRHTSAEHSDHRHSHAVAGVGSETYHDHDADTRHPDEAEHHPTVQREGDSHGSHKHDGKGGSCCSTLRAAVQSAKSITVPKQILQPLALFCVLLDGRNFTLDTRDAASDRPPWRGEWVFTPEVCTGLANRSHAPPSLHLI